MPFKRKVVVLLSTLTFVGITFVILQEQRIRVPLQRLQAVPKYFISTDTMSGILMNTPRSNIPFKVNRTVDANRTSLQETNSAMMKKLRETERGTRPSKTNKLLVPNKNIKLINGVNLPIVNQQPPVGLLCREKTPRELRLLPNDGPLTALASPWRSGNTWVRHLLQQATGIGTSSIYCDPELQSRGFPYECYRPQTSRKVLVIKTHDPELNPGKPNSARKAPPNIQYDRAILIIRNPYDFIVANIYSDHLSTLPEHAFFKNLKWQQSQPKLLDWWNNGLHFWLLDFQKPVLPILYSKILIDIEGELRRMLDFLKWPYSETDIACAMKYKEGQFHRKSRKWTKITSIVELFKPEMQIKINNSIDTVSKLLKTKYDLDWL